MPSQPISSPETVELESFTPEQQTDLNQWYDQLDEQWLTTIANSNSEESQVLAKMEAKWEAEQEYYCDRFLYADRL